MTKREQERIKQHAPHGWVPFEWRALTKPARATNDVLMVCPCGWSGWLSKEIVCNEAEH